MSDLPVTSAVQSSASDSGEWMSPVSIPAGQPAERLLWLGFDRASALTDARWARQEARMNVQVVRSVAEADSACKVQPLACVVEFELANGENGVNALELLRSHGVRVPAVLITALPELAVSALQRSSLTEAIPVISRSERYDRLRDWFEQLQMCLALGA